MAKRKSEFSSLDRFIAICGDWKSVDDYDKLDILLDLAEEGDERAASALNMPEVEWYFSLLKAKIEAAEIAVKALERDGVFDSVHERLMWSAHDLDEELRKIG